MTNIEIIIVYKCTIKIKLKHMYVFLFILQKFYFTRIINTENWWLEKIYILCFYFLNILQWRYELSETLQHSWNN